MAETVLFSDTELPPPPGGLSLEAPQAPSPDDVEAADYASRAWVSAEAGPLKAGTAAHTQAVARMFRETFNPYKPLVLNWPRLDEDTRRRIVSLPIWDIAVQTEGKARLRMATYAAS